MAIIRFHQQSTNPFLQAIEGDTGWDAAILTYAFADYSNLDYFISDEFGYFVYAFEGDFDPLDAHHPTDRLIRQDIAAAMKAWELVADVPQFVPTPLFDHADIKISGASGWRNSLGFMNFPGYNFKETLFGYDIHDPDALPEFESVLLLATDSALYDRAEKGGGHLGAYNALHEIGHGLGLGHPHDIGGYSVEVSSRGENAEEVVWDNQRYTVMSYEKPGWNENYLGIYGFAVTPSALDITAIQNMYGATRAYEGNNVYTLTDARTAELDTDGTDGKVQIGRAFYSIWDTGGRDTIAYEGRNHSVLNLNNASLSLSDTKRLNDSEARLADMKGYKNLPIEIRDNIESPDYHGGGFFSAVFSNSGQVQLGGYSIASDIHNGNAKIENARGGSGDDILVGNEGNNRLIGGAGNDMIVSSSGRDSIFADHGNDQIAGEAGQDLLDGGRGRDIGYLSDISRNYSINKIAPGITVISHDRGSQVDGTDTLINVEKLAFKDKTLTIAPEESGRSAMENFVIHEFALYSRHHPVDEFIWPEEQIGKSASVISGTPEDDPASQDVFETADDFLI